MGWQLQLGTFRNDKSLIFYFSFTGSFKIEHKCCNNVEDFKSLVYFRRTNFLSEG